MSQSQVLQRIGLLCLTLLFGGCTTMQPQHLSGYRALVNVATIETVPEPGIDHAFVDDIGTETLKMYRDGYVMLGYSNAITYGILNHMATTMTAKTQAEKVGATQIRHFRKAIGGTHNHEVATFWVKPKEFALGAYYADPSPEQSNAIGKYHGAEVLMIAKNTPADALDLMPGDLILTLNDVRIANAQMLDYLLEDNAGSQVVLGIAPKSRDRQPFQAYIRLGDPYTGGIGAGIDKANEEDRYGSVSRLMPGGGAESSGQIKVGDKILEVEDKNGRMRDMEDKPLDEIVGLLRGPKGSKVRVLVEGPDGSKREATVTRNTVLPPMPPALLAQIQGEAN